MLLMTGLAVNKVKAEEREAPNWDISGDWLLDLGAETENRKFHNLVQDAEGNVDGEFWWKPNDDFIYGGVLKGYVSENDVYLFYDRDPINYTGEFVGTITENGMTGTFQGLEGTSYRADWSTNGKPKLLYEARFTGGGQIVYPSEEINPKNRKTIDYKISFGMGIYIVNGATWFDGMEITFHNVSNPDVTGGKFVAERGGLSFPANPGNIGRFNAWGTFNGKPGYYVIVRSTFDESLRIMLYKWFPGQPLKQIYTSTKDFGDSTKFPLTKGNLKIEDLR